MAEPTITTITQEWDDSHAVQHAARIPDAPHLDRRVRALYRHDGWVHVQIEQYFGDEDEEDLMQDHWVYGTDVADELIHSALTEQAMRTTYEKTVRARRRARMKFAR